MNKDILAAAIGRNEPVPLLVAEPFDRSVERLRRAGGPAIESVIGAVRARRDGGTRINAENIDDERPLRPGTDLAGNRGTLADIVIAGTAQGGHRQKRVLRTVGHCDKAE